MKIIAKLSIYNLEWNSINAEYNNKPPINIEPVLHVLKVLELIMKQIKLEQQQKKSQNEYSVALP